MDNSTLQEAGLLSTYDPAAPLSFHDRINSVNAQILLDLSPTRRKPEFSKQPQQRYGADLKSWKSSQKLALLDYVYITSLPIEHGTSGIFMKVITCEATRWLAAERLQAATHRLSTNQDIEALNTMNEDNYRQIEVAEARQGRDMDGGTIPRTARNRQVKI